MAKVPNINPEVIRRMRSKAARSDCTYKVSAIAFDRKGDVLGHSSNQHSDWDVVEKSNGIGRAGTSKHAERQLIQRYGENVKTILICRVGNSGNLLPIDACPTCQKIADKLGIKIMSISTEGR